MTWLRLEPCWLVDLCITAVGLGNQRQVFRFYCTDLKIRQALYPFEHIWRHKTTGGPAPWMSPFQLESFSSNSFKFKRCGKLLKWKVLMQSWQTTGNITQSSALQTQKDHLLHWQFRRKSRKWLKKKMVSSPTELLDLNSLAPQSCKPFFW